MKKLLLLLLTTSTMWGQSFWDTSISWGADGITETSNFVGSVELRYNKYISADAPFLSASLKNNLTAVPPTYTNKPYSFDMDLYARVGVGYEYGRFLFTGGTSIKPAIKNTYRNLYFRTDFILFRFEDYDNQSIRIMVDVEENLLLMGIVFKDVFKL